MCHASKRCALHTQDASQPKGLTSDANYVLDMFMAIDITLLEDAATKLITLGVSLAQHIHDRTTAQPDTDLVEASKAFERVSRGTRRAIMLARKLAEPPRRTAARKRIIRDVEDVIQRDADDDEGETLHAELMDRLDSPDLEDDIDSLPVEAIITDILRDFGLAHLPGTHPWKRRTPDDVAELNTRAAAPARPRAPLWSAQDPSVPAAPILGRPPLSSA